MSGQEVIYKNLGIICPMVTIEFFHFKNHPVSLFSLSVWALLRHGIVNPDRSIDLSQLSLHS